MPTRDDARAETLAVWLRGKGFKCRVLPEDPCTNAAVLVEGTDWGFLCARKRYYPTRADGERRDPVMTLEQVLTLLGE